MTSSMRFFLVDLVWFFMIGFEFGASFSAVFGVGAGVLLGEEGEQTLLSFG